MEVAIPLIALGGMYVISNQSSRTCNPNTINRNVQKNKENFDNMGKHANYLPNAIVPPQNYPVSNLNQLVDTVQNYPNPNAATDKYFDQNIYEQKTRHGIHNVGNLPQEIYSMTGNYLESNQFKHNNMMPLNGGKIKGNTYRVNVAETVLDNMNGSGSQTIKKIEQAPLFKPEENISWAYGTPNNSDFYQSRENPAMRALGGGVKPFESVMVGPGLNQGFSSSGSGGYNSGMEARDKWLPYTVDQMRTANNPKLEYELLNHEGPANSFIKTAASSQTLGRVEKQRPDTYFINTQDRWLTTTGATKGETLRSIQEMGVIKRNDIVTNYTGPAGSSDATAGMAPENYDQSRRINLSGCGVNPSSAGGRGPSDDGDKFLRSHTNYENNRSTIKQTARMSGVSGAIGAVIAPLLDLLKPTRKDETINNIRIYGDMSSSVPGSYVSNPNDTTNTTIKETTLYSPTFNIDGQKEGMYVDNYTAMDLTQRDTTSASYTGTSGGGATQYGDMNYDSAYRQHNNDIKSATIVNRPNQGGMQIFNQQMNIHCKEDCNRFDGRMNPAFSRISSLPPSTDTYGSINTPQYYNECAGCDRIQPDILNAFKNNPYTHSLTTSV